MPQAIKDETAITAGCQQTGPAERHEVLGDISLSLT
jgi:hypothetical protein